MSQVDRGEWTRLRLLLELVQNGPRRPVELAEHLGVSAQAVSYQVRALGDEGLASADEAKVRATTAGVEWLHDRLLEVKRFVDDAVKSLLPLERCSAIAGEMLSTGDEVGLFMERGQLVARRAGSPSRGTVVQAGPAGGVVVVDRLTGIVELDAGRVLACLLPDPLDGLPPPARLKALVDGLPRAPALVCAAGVEAGWLCRRAGFGDVIEHAAAAVALDAARSGLDVLLVVAHQHAPPVLDALKAAGEGPGSARVEVVPLAA